MRIGRFSVDQPRTCAGKELCAEVMACTETLSKWSAFTGMVGTGLRVGDKLVAFNLCERLSPGTGVCLFEKADRDAPGAAALILKYGAERALCSGMGLEFANREQDCGDPGLREAKRGYHPCHMVEKYTAELVPGVIAR